MWYFHPVMRIPLVLRLIVVSFLLNLALATSTVFTPLYAKSIGSSNLEVGFIAATFWIVCLISSLYVGRQSDIHGRLRFVCAGLGLSIMAYLYQYVAHTTYTLLVARGFVGLCQGVISAALMAYTYENQKKIGNFASFGSLGILFGSLTAAVLNDYQTLLLISAASSVVAFLMSLTLTPGRANRIQVALFPLSMIRANLKIYLPFFLRQFGGYAIWAVFPLYLSSIGASKFWIALFDGINTGTQFVFMLLMEKFNPAKLFRTGLVISTLVFLSYGLANHFLQIIPLQIVLGISWSTMFVGALNYLFRKNQEHGTASGILFSSINLASSLGPFMGGAISQFWGFVPLMFFSSGMAFISFLTSWGLKTDNGAEVIKSRA